jgi:hypothetical protein
MVEILHQPRNEILHEKSRQLIIREAGPILTRLLQEGIREGEFDCRYPAQTVEMVMLYVLVAFDEQAGGVSTVEMVEKVDAFIANLERLFGAKKGSFDFIRQLSG